jgi:hypothetical protein
MRGKMGKNPNIMLFLKDVQLELIYVVLLEMQNIFQAVAGMLPAMHRGNGKQTSCNYKTHQITSL